MAQQQAQYFDLITSGIGYMKRLRFVTPDKSKGQRFKPFMAVSICAIVGEGDDIKYVSYDVNVKGEQAKAAMEVLKPHLIGEDGKPLDNKVLVGFRIGDAIPEIYTVTKEGKPENRVSLKGRLLKLTWAKVNGENIVLPKTAYDQAQEATAAEAEAGNGQAE